MLKWFSKTFGIQTCCLRPAWNWTPEYSREHALKVEPAAKWSSWLWHYVDTRDVAWAHRLAFDALDRLPPHDAFLIHAADHAAMEDSRELVEKLRPDLLQSSPVYLSGRQAFYSCEKAHNAFGYRGRYSWTDWL
jgi:nucleoside-diphosphate-sugar epimerase